METSKIIAASLLAFLVTGYLLVGLKGIMMFILGAVTVVLIELWLFIRYVSRDPNEINGPLRVIHEYIPKKGNEP